MCVQLDSDGQRARKISITGESNELPWHRRLFSATIHLVAGDRSSTKSGGVVSRLARMESGVRLADANAREAAGARDRESKAEDQDEPLQ